MIEATVTVGIFIVGLLIKLNRQVEKIQTLIEFLPCMNKNISRSPSLSIINNDDSKSNCIIPNTENIK